MPMKVFLRKLLVFSIIVPTVFLIGLLLPPTPLAKEYLLTKKPMKDSLLANVKAPRIIFVAGSSMAFGLDSQVFRDSLNRFPINTGLHGGMGLFYMLENTAKYVKKRGCCSGGGRVPSVLWKFCRRRRTTFTRAFRQFTTDGFFRFIKKRDA